MSLRFKIPAVIAAGLLLLALAASSGLWRLAGANAELARTLQANAASERAVAGMLVSFKVQVQEWKDTLLRGKDVAKLQKHWAAFEKREKEVADASAGLLGVLPEGPGRILVERFARAHVEMGTGYRAGLQAYKSAGSSSQAGDEAVAGIDREPARLLAEAADELRRQSAERSAAAEDRTRTVLWTTVAAIAGVGVAALVGAIAAGGALSRPILRAAKIARAVAGGDLRLRIEAHGRDEIAELLRALAQMQASLAEVVRGARRTSEQVASASTQIASGNTDLSTRTEQQAAALQQTASSMEQLGATVRSNADNARQASQLALGASDVAARGGATVGQVIETMRGIDDSSRRIAEIIGVIDGIAFQTNILALNAAVEAARAGEQGRGFAVVAGEVRGLAQRSADAARQIKSLITASVERVQQGSSLVDQAGATMTDVVASIRRVADIVAEISAASAEQSTGVTHLGAALARMDQSTQQNAALVEQGAAAAASLREQAGGLVGALGVFKVAA